MQIISATVRYPGGQPRTSSSGRPYVSALFTTQAGDEVRVFAAPDSSVTQHLQQLQPGQTARLAIDSRGRAHYCVPDQETAPMGFTAPPAPMAQPVVQQQAPANHQPVTAVPAAADAVLELAEQWARAYGHLVSRGVDPAVAGPGASTIVIQLGRR